MDGEAIDNYDFDLIGPPGRAFSGYISSWDKTAVTPTAMVRGSKNVYRKPSGTIAVRPGLKRFDEADDTIAGVLSGFTWNTSLATERVLRVVNNKLQVMSNILDSTVYLWYDLQDATGFDDYVFDTWWNDTLKKDELIFVRGDSNLYMWQGGIGKIVSTTVNTITLNASVASLGFNTTSGSVVINGTTYAYTGSSGNDLTGVTPDPTGEAADSVVVSTVVTTSNSPASTFTNDFIKVINNRLHVGSYTSRLVYISDQSDYTDFGFSTPRIPGEGEILTLDSVGKGIGVRQGQAHIFGGTSDLYIVSYQDITVGSTLTQQTKVDKKALANLEAALNHNFIGNIGDDLIWLSQQQDLKLFGTLRNLNEPVYPTLSLAIQQELQEQDFDGGALSVIGRFVYLTSPDTGAVWLYELRTTVNELGNVETERLWHPPFIWNLSRIIAISGVEYGFSNANPQLYQMWDTMQWFDDSPDDSELPYACVVAMAYRQKPKRSYQNQEDKIYIEGYMANGSEVDAAIVLDYQGSTGVLAFTLNSPDDPTTFFSGNVGASLGDSSLGDNPLGEAVNNAVDEQDTLPKFRSILNATPTDNFEYQLRVYSDAANARWELLSIGTNAQPSLNNPVYISKS